MLRCQRLESLSLCKYAQCVFYPFWRDCRQPFFWNHTFENWSLETEEMKFSCETFSHFRSSSSTSAQATRRCGEIIRHECDRFLGAFLIPDITPAFPHRVGWPARSVPPPLHSPAWFLYSRMRVYCVLRTCRVNFARALNTYFLRIHYRVLHALSGTVLARTSERMQGDHRDSLRRRRRMGHDRLYRTDLTQSGRYDFTPPCDGGDLFSDTGWIKSLIP